MSLRGAQSQAVAKTEGSAVRAPESGRAARAHAPGGASMLLRLQNGPGNRAAAGLLLRSGLLQPSLRVGAAHDPYEREADRMADRVMRDAPGTEVSALPAPAPATAQRMCAECEEEEAMQREATGADGGGPAGGALESRVAALRGGGVPLSPAQRGFFEPRFGHDFGGVRLHSGPAAAEAARLARARAFTVGRDIAFAAGEYRPETNSGQRLLAHELTHVVQQTPLVARRKPLLQRQAAPGADAAGPAGPQPETPGPESPGPEQEPEPAGPEADEAANAQTPAPGLLVEDDAETVGPEQMTRGAFLAEVRASACAAVDSALAGTEMSSQGCPYVELILRFYERRSAERIERDLVNYAPEAANVTSARGYVPIVAERVRQSAVTYAETGEITGIPEGVPLGLRLLAGAGALFGGLFFKARDGGPRGSAHPRAVRAQLGAGRPLGGSVSSRMQSAFGRGFSGVRVHTDATASRLSSRFNARAFTVGQHVAFGAGEYRPGTPVGDALIAHELAHVVQQRGAGDAVAPMQSGPGTVGALERDADRSAAGVVASLWGGAKGAAARIARNAVPNLRSGLRLQRCPSSQQTRPPQAPAPQQPSPQRQAETLRQKDSSGCAVPDSYLNILNETGEEGLLGYTKIDQSSHLDCVPRLVKGTGANFGTCTFQPVSPNLSITAKHVKKEGALNSGRRIQIPGCSKDVPIYFVFSDNNVELARQAEQEHCDDLQIAFDRTLRPCAARVNKFANQPLIGSDENHCFRDLISKVGFDPFDCSSEFVSLAKKTDERDNNDWHLFEFYFISRNCNKAVVGFKKSATNRIGDPAVAPSQHIPAATKCSVAASSSSAPSPASQPSATPNAAEEPNNNE